MVYMLEIATLVGVVISLICLMSALENDLKRIQGNMPVSEWLATLQDPDLGNIQIDLPPGVLIMGNRKRDNLYVDCSEGPRIKLYVNVPGLEVEDDPDHMKVTVLSGSVKYGEEICNKNPNLHLLISDNQSIKLNGKEVYFVRRH